MTPSAPPVPDPFSWRDGQIAIDLPGGHALFTTRTEGVAGTVMDLKRWTEPQSAHGPIHALAAQIGVAPERLAQSHQVHEARVRTIASAADLERSPSDFDAQVTSLKELACVVRVADCLPVALIAPEAVGVVHAGWRGLAADVLAAAVAALRGCGATAIRAAIGPGARVCCYEAGDEVHSAFADIGAGARAGSYADLPAVASARLARAGVTEVHDVRLCTICAPPGLLWSYRRDGAAAGRQGGVAWRS